jgi:hypothetical protein
MTDHDPMCPADRTIDIDCWFCPLIDRVRADEATDAWAKAGAAARTQYKRDLRAQVEALRIGWKHDAPLRAVPEVWDDALDEVLALLDEEYMPRSRSDAPAGRATKSLFDEEATP